MYFSVTENIKVATFFKEKEGKGAPVLSQANHVYRVFYNIS